MLSLFFSQDNYLLKKKKKLLNGGSSYRKVGCGKIGDLLGSLVVVCEHRVGLSGYKNNVSHTGELKVSGCEEGLLFYTLFIGS